MTILREVDSGKDHFISLPCLIGRGEEADLVLADHTVSHRHALIDSSDDQLWIKDLDSVNGVCLNGERIFEKTFLHPGDFIQLGQSKFLLPVAEEEKSEQTIILHALDRTSVAREMDRRRLDLIYSITAEFPSSQDIIHIGEKIFARFKDFFHQDHGTIALFQENGELRTLCCDSRMEPLPFSRSIVNRVLQNGESLLLEDALSSDSFKQEESVIALRIRSAMCAPLIYHNRINGLIYLDRNISGAYSQSDLELFQSIGHIIAPLIENARLWSELKKKYSNTVDKLRKTETRLIDTERVAAYVRLSQAMAHEVRNPLVILGGLIRGMGRSEQSSMGKQKCQAILQSVDRIEAVLQEVDGFARIAQPEKQLVKIDSLVQEVLDSYQEAWREKKILPLFCVETPQVMAPVDPSLLRKALAMVIKEILFGIGRGSELPVTLRDFEGGLELCFGRKDERYLFSDPFAPVFLDKPWCNSLFLNIAHKILLDHGGKLLLNTEGHGILPLVLFISRSTTTAADDRAGLHSLG